MSWSFYNGYPFNSGVGQQQYNPCPASPGRFWLVWCPTHALPKGQRTHATQDSAEAEAKRQAQLHPGESFYVCEALKEAAAKLDPVKMTDLS